MQVTNNHGQIVEENHYYPFGLRIASLSSRKMADSNEGRTGNKHLYNDKELIDDAGLNWYDYGFRNYDPQTGRFPQLDPLTDDYPFLTPYQYASNDPITNIDLDGLEGVISTTAGTAKVLAPVTVIGRMPGSVASASNAVLNAGVRVGLDGVNMLTSQSISQAEFRNRQATVTGISERQMRGYNWWHDAKELDFTGRISILDGFINPVYRTLQQISAKATGQSIIRNLDGTRAGYSSSRSQSDVKQRVFDFVQTGSVFIGPAYAEANKATSSFDAVNAFKNAISPYQGGELTNAGRAVTKHPKYFGFKSNQDLRKVYRTTNALNNLGSTTLKDIIRNGVKTTGASGRYANGWVTYTLPNGTGASWGIDEIFIGFRGIK